MTILHCTCSHSRVTVHETVPATVPLVKTTAYSEEDMTSSDLDVSASELSDKTFQSRGSGLVAVMAEAVPCHEIRDRRDECVSAWRPPPAVMIALPEPPTEHVACVLPWSPGGLVDAPEVIATPVEAIPSFCMYEDGNAWNRPEFLSATIVRESVDQKFGITFTIQKDTTSSNKRGMFRTKRQKRNRLPQISDLHEEGLLSQAPFCVGDLLVSINKQCCRGMYPAELTNLLGSLTGTITMVVRHPGGDASLVESFLRKPSPFSKTGVGLMYHPRLNRLKVKHVHHQGLLGEGLLQVEDRIVAINHIPCQHGDAREAVEQIARSPLWVSIVARRHRNAGVVLTVQEEPPAVRGPGRSWCSLDGSIHARILLA